MLGTQRKNSKIPPSSLCQNSKLHSVMLCLNMRRGGRRMKNVFYPSLSQDGINSSTVLYNFSWPKYQSTRHFCIGSLHLYLRLNFQRNLLKKTNRRGYVLESTNRCKLGQVETESALSSGPIAWTKKAPGVFGLIKIPLKPIVSSTRFRSPENNPFPIFSYLLQSHPTEISLFCILWVKVQAYLGHA